MSCNTEEVIKCLLQWDCCPRCCLRLIGEPNQQQYCKNEHELYNELLHMGDKSLDKSAEMCTFKEKACIACLGVLQQKNCNDNLLQEVKAIVHREGHNFLSFNLTISTPVNLLIRQHSLNIALKEKFGSVFSPYQSMSIKEVWKITNLQRLEKVLNCKFDSNGTFVIALNFMHPGTERDCSFLMDCFPDIFRKRKHNRQGWEVYTRASVVKCVENLEDSLARYYPSPPVSLDSCCDCDPITCKQDPVYLAGRYNKYSRNLSQTQWIIDGQRKTESSVEELICEDVKSAFSASECRFSSAGREDVDVRMLGDGRPFVVEIQNPKRVTFDSSSIFELQKKINNATEDIKVRCLQIVPKEQTSNIKEGEAEKVKCYSALCWSEKELNAEILGKLRDLKELVLHQKTPLRVLHRRPLAVRKKVVHSMSAVQVDSNHFKLSLKTQAGTYIKEFVHGDLGRTKPNLSDILGCTCDILELDVEAILLDWPKPTKEEMEL